MDRTHVVAILAMITALDRRTVGDADVAAWAAVLDGLDPGDCRAAVITHFRERPDVWCQPGHIVALARAARRDRHSRSDPAERERAAIERDARRSLVQVTDVAAAVQIVADSTRIPFTRSEPLGDRQ